MDKKESKRQLVAMLESGRSKTEIFKTLSGGEVKDRVLAYWIGAYADPALCQRHSGKIKTLLLLTIAQALLGAVSGYFLGSMIGPSAAMAFTLFAAVVPLLFAWGFYKNVAQVYTIYVILSLSQFPKMFQGFEEDPLLTLVGAGITLGMVFFAAYLKTLLFPDLGFLGSKKVKGHYVFSS